jgi:glycosyltransferase involved in cell wall biosynthesis
MTCWHLLTGEYPPQPGGVSDYTHRLAAALAAEGDDVRVWAPPSSGDALPARGVTVHRLPDHFGPRGLHVLGAALHEGRLSARLLVQYVPHMYGWRGMNLPFALWLWALCPLRCWVMFHEVRGPMSRRLALRHNVQGGVQALMAALVDRSAERAFVSTPHWETLLRSRPHRPVVWTPIPSAMPTERDPAGAAAVRARLRFGDSTVVGHFGTFGEAIAANLAGVLPALLRADRRRRALLIGLGSEAFAASLTAAHPDLAGQMHATGMLSPEQVAAHLATCDLLVQPYPDGVTTRRSSVMAGLALGVPVVTTRGFLTEPLWSQEPIAALVPGTDGAALIAAVESFLADHQARRRLGEQCQAGYQRYFTLARTVSALRGADAQARRGTT